MTGDLQSAPVKQEQVPARGIEVRHCHGLAELERCAQLEKAVWGFDECVPMPIYVVAAETGGQVLGAFLGELLVGFTMAMPGLHAEAGLLQPFLHSHMTAVLPGYRDRGVGRRLKLFQREDALARGVKLVEWTFDPLEMRNAHFNFMRLGAVARRFLPNCYGITSSPLHCGMPTDRLVAEWWLDSPRVRGALEGSSQAVAGVDAKRIAVPARMEAWRSTDRAKAIAEQARIAGEFERLLAQGYVVTGIENTREGCEYVLEPWDAVAAALRSP
ncbi:MAG: acetyltransferase [Candidatus Acidiferrales bacterium]